jgi:hypothetical protein
MGKGLLRDLGEAFDRNSVGVKEASSRRRESSKRSRRQVRELPVRRLRTALWDVDRDVSREQVREYMVDAGLRSTDSLRLGEFAKLYHYLFMDDVRDKGHPSSYHDRVLGEDGGGRNGKNKKSQDGRFRFIDATTRHAEGAPSGGAMLTIAETSSRVYAEGG